MNVPSRPLASLALVAALVAGYLPGTSATRVISPITGPPPSCCGAMACCHPGHDCAMHGGCDGMGATGAPGSAAPTKSAAPTGHTAPHTACLATPGCSANQPVPAPHVFDPMLPAFAGRAVAPPAGDRAVPTAQRAPRDPAFEPSVPPPRA